jgi:alpha-glucosidase (family GH31 glycosyl hydrolase)
MKRNGQRIKLYNNPHYGYELNADELNYSVPFVMGSTGYGLFFDNPSKGYIDFGASQPHTMEAGLLPEGLTRTSFWAAAPSKCSPTTPPLPASSRCRPVGPLVIL